MTVYKEFHTPTGKQSRALTDQETDPDLVAEYQKDKDIINNLPDWSTVSNNIDNISNLNEAKIFIKKLSRIVYWLAKDSNT